MTIKILSFQIRNEMNVLKHSIMDHLILVILESGFCSFQPIPCLVKNNNFKLISQPQDTVFFIFGMRWLWMRGLRNELCFTIFISI